ncbi:hypothetical protein DPMN_124644 [Dreissena polymorpha]|uniref:Uncharacterized protein n=1 Tax=Dreissena polymorpha TaxID=45954 RepID=A0A9D4GTX2_DREPO|nr:hypothetical protein DPMN_124644 [Dreissena polymorpha]
MNGRKRPASAYIASDARNIHPKMFSSTHLRNRDPIYINKQYSDKRQPSFTTDDSLFYLAIRTVPSTDNSDQWYLRQKLGKNKWQDIENYGNRGRLCKNKNT